MASRCGFCRRQPRSRKMLAFRRSSSRGLPLSETSPILEGVKQSDLAGLDTRLIPSVAETFRHLDAMKLVDMKAVSQASKTFEFVRPLVAPQVAEILKGMDTRIVAPSFAEALKKIQTSPPFNFAKTLEGMSAAIIQPHVADALATSLPTLSLPKTASTGIADVLRDLSRVSSGHLAPRAQEAAEEAVALAEVGAVAEIVDESFARLRSMSPAQRRILANDVVVLIAAFLVVAGLLAESGYMKGAGAMLAFSSALVRVYWRLTGKVD
jgi:hypothetical protein